MELKAGYKKTEVGVIPDDWKVKKLGDLSSLKTGPFGSALHKSDYVADGIPVINPMHLVDGCISPSRDMTVTPSAAKRLSEYQLRDGDVIIGRRGEMGRCSVVRENQRGWLCGTGSLIIRSNGEIIPEYLQRVLSSPEIVKTIEGSSVGSTMINLNQSLLRSLDLQAPPLPEQRAIAAALSDVDALIGSLDALIAKKRAIKQGAMQQLLAGKKRLLGFSGAWEEKHLNDIADIDSDNLSSNTNPDYSFKYISLEDVDKGVLKGYSNLDYRSAPSRARRKVKKDDILVSTVRPNLKSHLLFRGNATEVICSTGFSVIRCHRALAEPSYIYFHLFANYIGQQIESLISGSNYPAINSGDVKALRIPIPSLPEQKAIAAILSDMDAEIAALEARRDKTRTLKQGMMQELLTGKTRLL